MEKECLIYYSGLKGRLFGDYCRQLEDIGFAFDKRIDFKSLDYDVGKFIYAGDRLQEDIEKVKSIDSRISVEVSKQYVINEK